MARKQMFAGGGRNLQNNLLTRNIKEFNVIILILIATLIIGIAGATSLALFSGETSSVSKITGTVVSPKLPTGAEIIIKKVGTGGLVAETHSATEQLQETTDYRYTGVSPNNYVSFNNELWRIIGVFDVDDGTGNIEQRIKITRSEFIGDIAWDDNGVNDWSKATGMALLNSGDYYNRIGDYELTGLTDEAKLMIDDAKWYLGGVDDDNVDVAQFYSYERGTSVYGENSTSWIGEVALVYPSDYVYATSGGDNIDRETCLSIEHYNWSDSAYSDCYGFDWLYDNINNQWALTHSTSTSLIALIIKESVFAGQNNWVNRAFAFRPTVYLSSDIQISGGSGILDDPYQLSK